MTDDHERLTRMKTRAEVRRATAIASIRAVYDSAMRVHTEPDIVPTFLASARDLDLLWSQFKAEDESVLDCLIALGTHTDYSSALQAEVRALVNTCMAVSERLVSSEPHVPNQAHLINSDGNKEFLSHVTPGNEHPRPLSRLPEIPLPEFDGDCNYWPTFRDRFKALVDSRPTLSNIEKMYYLIGCLKGPAHDVVRRIPVSADNYDLAWKTLSARFNRPRLVATSLVDELLRASVSTQETLSELNGFLSLFSESISLLNSLEVPDMGSFILFTIAFRCLPMATRKLFEASVISDYPSLDSLLEFVQSRVSILELVSDPCKKVSNVSINQVLPLKLNQRNTGSDRVQRQRPNRPTSLVTANSTRSCPCCQGDHVIALCPRFLSWAVDERGRWTRSHGLCLICFDPNHWANKCQAKTRCTSCAKNHHSLLHPAAGQSRADPAPSAKTSLCASMPSFPACKSSSVVLGTTLVHIRDRAGSWHVMRALVDSASEISAITAASVDRLGLRRTRWTTPVSGLSGVPVVDVQGKVNCLIQPRFANEPGISVQAWVLPSITGNIPRSSLSSDIRDRFSDLALADPTFHVASPVDLLLGGDVYPSIMDGRKFVVDSTLPSAFSSIFGWILIGPVSHVVPSQSLPVSLTVSIEGLMERFWRTEEPDEAPSSFTDHGRCEELFRAQYSRLPSGRFSVPLPFRAPVEPDVFSTSRDMAVKRFDALERKLSTDPKLKLLYTDFMSEYLKLGHMSIATSPGAYFIPHHAVYRPGDGDSKLRVVFDASARSFRGPSLNCCLFTGPKLQQEIVDILLRFRIHSHAFTADICKMYRQILILPEHRRFQHILWRPSPEQALIEYELNTVTYGVNSAPFLALRVLHAIATEDCDDAASVRDALLRQTYVDDICVGADSINDALDLQSKLIAKLGHAGLELKKWASNTPEILNAVPADSRVAGPLPFDEIDGVGTKVLGLEWHPLKDCFSCALRLDPPPVYSKRGVLSLLARIFDPLGLFGPTIFLAKTIMQRTWVHGLSWDDPLPDDIQLEWSAFVTELPSLLVVQIPRFIGTRSGASCFLLGFCDASLRGYAAVVYLRTVNTHGESVISLIGTKSKLAPMKALSVPRLELNAAVLLSRWLNRIRNVLESQLNILAIHAWTDSSIVLSWLTVPHTCFKPYVSNRVHQIRSLMPHCQWHHIGTTSNPADCASRGVRPSELAQLPLYWHGPPCLYDDPSTWGCDHPLIPVEELPETRPVSLATQVVRAPVEWFVRFSTFDQMVRIIAWMRRFVNHCRHRKSTSSTILDRVELDEAERVVVIEAQSISFATLRTELGRGNRVTAKPLARLSPFLDSDGVIRVGGRLRHSDLPYNRKHPVLLPKASYLSVLICRKWHKLSCHSGPRIMSSLIHLQYWIMSLRSVIHTVISRCTICLRFDAPRPQLIMADLPAVRVQEGRVFVRVGIDYAGPLQMRELQLRKSRIYKVYIAIFVCFSVKAVHLELVSDLSTEAFLAAFDRFVARRGVPTDVFSDCGTNFVGAAKQLRNVINSADSQAKISSRVTSCVWHFNPPGAPHFGGLWEAGVRSAKRLLFRVMGTHHFSYEEMSTVLCRIEAVLNSRPLTPLSSDPNDLASLTPGHFLVGQPLLAIPPRVNIDSNRTLQQRWKLLDQCHQAFWRRWSREYLHTLQERTKWASGQPNVEVDDLVIIRDANSPPLEWRLGRVAEVFPGPDAIVRVARVNTTQGPVTRPVVKLILLPKGPN